MTIFASLVPTVEQIPYLSSLGDEPAPMRIASGPRWRQMTSAEKVLYAMSETEWQEQVIAIAELFGWWWWRDNMSTRNRRGMTDLVLFRDRIVWAELKKETGKSRPGQPEFATRVIRARGEHYVWRPRHKAQVLEVLR